MESVLFGFMEAIEATVVAIGVDVFPILVEVGTPIEIAVDVGNIDDEEEEVPVDRAVLAAFVNVVSCVALEDV